jgi:hypothetical protein
MAGIYREGESKVLSGVYSRIKAALATVTAGARGIVALPFTADWGPVNVLTPITLQPEFETLYNAGNANFTANKINIHAFKGKPSKVLAYRMATASAAKGVALLNDQAAATSLELETLYPTGRTFVAAVKDRVSGGKTIEILEGGVLLASVGGSSVAELEAALNATNFVRVKSKGANMPNNTAGVPFAGGNNGSTVTATEYAAFRTEVEADMTANAIALDKYDAVEIASTETWLTRVRDEGLYITFVSGGPAAWDTDPTLADTESKAFNYRGIINVGNGVDGYTAADLAIFVAARAASVELNQGLTDEIVPYDAVNKKLTKTQRVTAKQAGTLVFVQQGSNILIDEAVNTLTVPSGDETKEFGKIRVNNAVDYVLSSLEAFGEEYKRSRSNTDEARQTYAATVESEFFAPLAAAEVVQPTYFYRPDPEYHGKNAVYNAKIDEAFFYADFKPVDSMERVYQKMGVSFN